MLYNKELQQKSYHTSRYIIDKLNNSSAFHMCKFELNDTENFKEDGFITYINENGEMVRNTIELKQRQNEYIRQVLNKDIYPYDEVTIHKSSVDNGKDWYIIYDKSLNCVCVFHWSHIDRENHIVRMEKTERGWHPIKYYKIKDEFVSYIDLV